MVDPFFVQRRRPLPASARWRGAPGLRPMRYDLTPLLSTLTEYDNMPAKLRDERPTLVCPHHHINHQMW